MRSSKTMDFHFGIRHIILISMITILFLAVSSYINTISKNNLLSRTTDLYRKNSVENLADLTATSLELLLEQVILNPRQSVERKQNTIHSFDMILSQQALRENIKEICVLTYRENILYAIDNGEELYAFFVEHRNPSDAKRQLHRSAIDIFQAAEKKILTEEDIYSYIDKEHVFHIIVPLILEGEYTGVLYMQIGLDYRSLIKEISIGYSNISIIFTAVIMLGLLSMFFLSSYMVKERDSALRRLYEEKQIQLTQNVELQKEQLFARRIYHTHHKAEKIMGYIKKDLRSLNSENLDEGVSKIARFASYIQRVIYDMKSYNPPLNTVRNASFQSDINAIIEFIVRNVFGRPEQYGNLEKIVTELDPALPIVHINEYVIWEILEPLIHNSIDHNPDRKVTISVRTKYDPVQNTSMITIADNGCGINEAMLAVNSAGVQTIFLEHTTRKDQSENSGYGCYIAYQICKYRCAWDIQAGNNTDGGACFTVTVRHSEGNNYAG